MGVSFYAWYYIKASLGIACALMECPDLILLDEPINAIDEKGVPKIWEALQEEKQRGALIMLACHDTEELTSLADRIITIEEGKICSISSQIERRLFTPLLAIKDERELWIGHKIGETESGKKPQKEENRQNGKESDEESAGEHT